MHQKHHKLGGSGTCSSMKPKEPGLSIATAAPAAILQPSAQAKTKKGKQP